MTAALDSQRLEILVLARLATRAKKALTTGSLTKALRPFLERRLSAVEQRSHIERTLERLIALDQVAARPLALTDGGRRRLREFFATDRDLDWQVLRKHYVSATALALTPTDKVRKRIADKDGLRAGILWRHHSLPQTAPPTLKQAVDALVWRQLGVDTDGPLTLARIRAHFLQQMLGQKRPLPGDKLTQLAAARAARSDGLGPDHLRLALARDWLFPDRPEALTQPESQQSQPPGTQPGESPAPGDGTETTTETTTATATAPSLSALAGEVAAIASAVHDDGRYGERKVFISAIWQRIRTRPIAHGLTLDSFKDLLMQANRADLLRLHRADLVSAMPAQHVADSETTHLSATFHFVESMSPRSRQR